MNNIHRLVSGNNSGLPVVLINGLFAPLTSWDGAMDHLQQCRVLRYDGPGQGQSDGPEGIYHMDLLLETLERVMDEENWPTTWLVGLSNGGCIAMAAAARWPQRIKGLVVAGCYDQVSPLLRLKIQSWLAAHIQGGPAHRFDIATPWIWSERVLKHHPDMVDVYRKKSAEHKDHVVRGLLEGALSHHIDVDRIKQPTLVISGDEDLLTPPHAMRAMAQSMHNARFLSISGAHAALLEDASTFQTHILPFMEAAYVG